MRLSVISASKGVHTSPTSRATVHLRKPDLGWNFAAGFLKFKIKISSELRRQISHTIRRFGLPPAAVKRRQ